MPNERPNHLYQLYHTNCMAHRPWELPGATSTSHQKHSFHTCICIQQILCICIQRILCIEQFNVYSKFYFTRRLNILLNSILRPACVFYISCCNFLGLDRVDLKLTQPLQNVVHVYLLSFSNLLQQIRLFCPSSRFFSH